MAFRGAETIELGGVQEPLLRRVELDEVLGRIHQRLARAGTPIVFLLLGFPLALIFRSGNRMVSFLLASMIAMFVYYPTERLGNMLMTQRLAGPVIACWSGNLLLAAIGGGLLAFVVRR
jgi:lipopolysaccharide export LptBFGC system permease protein LptF